MSLYSARRLYLIRTNGPFLHLEMPPVNNLNDDKFVMLFRAILNHALADYLGDVDFLEDTDDYDLDEKGASTWEEWLSEINYHFCFLCDAAKLDPDFVIDTFKSMEENSPYT